MKPKPQRFWAVRLANGSLAGAWATVWGGDADFEKQWAHVLPRTRARAAILARVFAEEGAEVVRVEFRVVKPKRKRKARNRTATSANQDVS